jgi:hypothetical protein
VTKNQVQALIGVAYWLAFNLDDEDRRNLWTAYSKAHTEVALDPTSSRFTELANLLCGVHLRNEGVPEILASVAGDVVEMDEGTYLIVKIGG